MDIKVQYLTYDEFVGLGGNLDNASFNLLEFEARKIIDRNTQGRLKELKSQIEEVKLCTFKLINTIQEDKKNQGKTSESVGSYSISYSTSTTKEEEEKNNQIVKDYLDGCFLADGTSYLYAGVLSVY